MVHGVKKDNILTCINLRAAFETVDHGILLNVLQTNLELVVMLCPGSNHICNQGFVRSTFIMQTQEDKELHFLVPQGGCVGPVLYSAYTSTLQEMVPLDLHGYANDHG